MQHQQLYSNNQLAGDTQLQTCIRAGCSGLVLAMGLAQRNSAAVHARTVTKFSFDAVHREGRPVGGRRQRPRSASGWSQGLALAALTPRTRQFQAAERRRNGASFRAAVAPPCDELSVVAREFAPTHSTGDLPVEVLPGPAPVRDQSRASSSHELFQLKRPHSAATPAARERPTQTRPHTAGSRRDGVRDMNSSTSVDRRPSTAHRQRIQLYREGQRQILAHKQAAEDKQLQTAGFRRQGAPGRWISQSNDDLRAAMVDCADAANRGNDNGANTVCHAEQQSQLLQQFAQPTGSGELRTEFFAFVAQQRRQLLAATGDVGDSQRPDSTEVASQLSKLWKEAHGNGSAGKKRRDAGGEIGSASGGGSSGNISRIDNLRDRAASTTQVSFADDRNLASPSPSRCSKPQNCQRASIGAAAATWWTPHKHANSIGSGSTRLSLGSAADLLRITCLGVPQVRSATKQSHKSEQQHETRFDQQQDNKVGFRAALGRDSDKRLLRLGVHSPELFAQPTSISQRFSEPISGSESLLQTGWGK